MGVRLATATTVLALLLISSPTSAAWERLKHFVQPGAVIEEETEDRLVLSFADSRIVIRMVLTTEPQDDSDIYGDFEVRRGGNPYRIWVATHQLWDDPERPRQKWGRLFRSQFLRAVRAPRQPPPPTMAR